MRKQTASSHGGSNPNFRLRQGDAGKGLQIYKTRFLNQQLSNHRAYDFFEENHNSQKKKNLCQVCRLEGKKYKLKNDRNGNKRKGLGYRGGVKDPRRACVMCIDAGCPRNYCSNACFNQWHYTNK